MTEVVTKLRRPLVANKTLKNDRGGDEVEATTGCKTTLKNDRGGDEVEAAPYEAPAEETAMKVAPSNEDAVEEAPSKVAAMQEASLKEAGVKEASPKKDATKETLTKVAAAKKGPAKEAATNDDTSKSAPKGHSSLELEAAAKKDAAKEAPLNEEQEEETDDELIEMCWQDLLKDGVSHEVQASDDDELVEAEVERWKHCEAKFDHDPQLPGDKSITSAINARLWSEARGLSNVAAKEVEKNEAKKRRTSPTQVKRQPENENGTGIQEGTQSDRFAKRARGASSERASKFQRGTGGRIQRDEMHAINRILKQCTATPTSCPSRNLKVDRCSSEEGPGSLLKRLPA